jgi:hypothetical protein
MMHLHKLTIKKFEDGGKGMFLDGIEVKGVTRYELIEEVGEPARLTLTLLIEDVNEVK